MKKREKWARQSSNQCEALSNWIPPHSQPGRDPEYHSVDYLLSTHAFIT